jgi:oligosaccharyltransferase complex subunit epsilon
MAGPKSTSSSKPSPTILGAIQSLWVAYNEHTADRLKFIDSFLVFIMLSGALQFLYCILVTNFPFNAFLAGYAPLS